MTGPTTTDEDYEHNNVIYVPSLAGPAEYIRQFPPDVGFSEEELGVRADELFKVLRMQLKWAAEEGEDLRAQVADLEGRRRKEWMGKELALENLLEGEVVGLERRGASGPEDFAMLRAIREDVKGAEGLELEGVEMPWWRLPRREVDVGVQSIEGPGNGVMA